MRESERLIMVGETIISIPHIFQDSYCHSYRTDGRDNIMGRAVQRVLAFLLCERMLIT
jgi:hypothetical protein